MTPERSTKEKILALFTVTIIFLLVGNLLFLISLDNKKITETLNNKILKIKADHEIALDFEKIHLATSSLPNITSKAYLTLAVGDGEQIKILIQKNPDLPLPIASITKLMVAVIILENVDLNTEVTATLDYIGKDESAFVLETNRKYKVKELLYNALIASDNDSARLLSSTLGENNFLDKMNLKAKELGLTQTKFANVTGLDPILPATGINLSTATDLANLLIYIKNNHPEILKITTNTNYIFCDINNYCKDATTTDKLLENNDIQYKIIGGKTGNTDLAGKNLVLMTELTDNMSLINVVLGSENNFTDTVSLINNVKVQN